MSGFFRVRPAVLALVLTLLSSSDAKSAGYTVPDTGTRAFGRGGAFVAKPTDLTAFYYNPAALTSLGNEVFLGLSMLNTKADFQRAPEEGGKVTFDPVHNQSPFFFYVPSAVIAHDFGIEQFKLAGGLITPLSGGYKFDKIGPQRYAVIDSEIGEVFYGLGAAYEPIKGLSFGLDALLTYVYTEFEQAYTLALDAKDHPENDGFFSMKADAINSPSLIAGVRYARGPLHAGLSFQPAMSLDLKGNVAVEQDIQFGRDPNNPEETPGIPVQIHDSKGITVPLKLPSQYRVGVGYDILRSIYAEAGFTYTQWGTLKQLVGDLDSNTFNLSQPITSLGDPPIEAIEISDVVVPLEFKDSYDLRLGIEWEATPFLTLRTGGLYESAAIPPQTQTPSLQDATKKALAGGATFTWNRVSFDLASGYLFYEDREVMDSQVLEINGLETTLIGDSTVKDLFRLKPKPVGNGRYEHGIFLLAVSTTIRL
ncbi:MAG: outer membrane protein transport protein [Nitrospirae bacterium]|nr:outer membrane protein transport protein [Nitrospirota bacterium]